MHLRPLHHWTSTSKGWVQSAAVPVKLCYSVAPPPLLSHNQMHSVASPNRQTYSTFMVRSPPPLSKLRLA